MDTVFALAIFEMVALCGFVVVLMLMATRRQ